MTRLLICFASLGFGFSTASAQSLLAWNDQNLSAVARCGVPTRCFETLREVELENLHQQVMVIVAEVSGRYQVMRITGRSGEYLIVDLGVIVDMSIRCWCHVSTQITKSSYTAVQVRACACNH